mmetsp:Transcript_46436/g.34114  ORF Transcript_46436/g.34114 Transcript_46436/m.34114 type:complete len:92 (+) Transcript_46436:245-520(+)
MSEFALIARDLSYRYHHHSDETEYSESALDDAEDPQHQRCHYDDGVEEVEEVHQVHEVGGERLHYYLSQEQTQEYLVDLGQQTISHSDEIS